MAKTQKGIWNIRILVPAFIGVVLSRIIAAYTVVADLIAWCDEFIFEVTERAGVAVVGEPTVMLLNAALTALTIWLWHLAATRLGDNWPSVEKWMLGSAARPHYEPRYAK